MAFPSGNDLLSVPQPCVRGEDGVKWEELREIQSSGPREVRLMEGRGKMASREERCGSYSHTC